MSSDAPDRQQQKVSEFLKLLPLTLAIAGLPLGEPGRPLTEGQMDSRATTIRTAYRVARQLLHEVIRPAEAPAS